MLAFIGILLVILLALGVPVAASVGLTAGIAVILIGDIPQEIIAQRFMTGVDSFPLLAVPFFILAGAVMNTGGITGRLVRLANAIVGRFTGGLGHVTVASNVIMAGMSGSAAADAAGTGSVLIPAMRQAGFAQASRRHSQRLPRPLARSFLRPYLLSCSASWGGVSVGRLFLGGAIPGLLMGLTLMVAVYVVSQRRGYARGSPPEEGELGRAFVAALPALMLPLIVIGAIAHGVVTPTEAAVLAVLYALFLGLFVYRNLPSGRCARSSSRSR